MRSTGVDAPAGGSAAPRMLVTGFGPFPGVVDNPSGRLAAAVDGEVIAGVPIVGRVLPVDWRAAWPLIEALVDEVEPAALVMFGVATDRPDVQIERVARNRCAPRADAVGGLPDGPRVVADAPDTLASRLPWQALIGPGVTTSDDAGAYLCNYCLYKAVHGLYGRVRYCGFVHLPASPTAGARDVLRRLARQLGSGADGEGAAPPG